MRTARITLGPTPRSIDEGPSSRSIYGPVRKAIVGEANVVGPYPKEGVEAMSIVQPLFWWLCHITLHADLGTVSTKALGRKGRSVLRTMIISVRGGSVN